MSKLVKYQLVEQRPSLMQRLVDGVRSITLGPFNPRDREIAKYFGGGPTSSGISVDEYSALGYSAVWSAVTMISDDIASLPLMLYKRLEGGGKDRFESHPLYRLLHDAPNPEMDAMVWRRTMQAHVLIWQNAYAEIERDLAGRPAAIWPLVPERVSVFRDRGALRYRYRNPSGNDVIYAPEDMIHLVGQSHDGSVGSSLVQHARESLSLGMAAEKFGSTFFGNGATFGGVISYKGPKPPEMSDKNYTDKLNARHQGVERAHKLLMVYNDGKYERIGIPPNDAQFLETRVFQIREVARWFKMPPHKLGDLADATYSNVEQMDAAYLSSCIRPWLVLWQQQLSRKLIARLERSQQFIEHDTHGFLSVDAAGRAELYGAEFNVGALTPNEIRGYENRDPTKGGDRAFVQLNMVPLDRVDEIIDADLESKKAAKEAKDTQVKTLETINEEKERALTQVRDELVDARRVAQQAEDQLDLAREELRKAAQAAVLAEAEHIKALGEKNAEIVRHVADCAIVSSERDRLAKDLSIVTGERDQAIVDRDDAVSARAVAIGERDEALERGRAAEQLLTTARADVASLTARIETLQTERDDARSRVSTLESEVAGLTQALTVEREARAQEAATQAETLQTEQRAKAQAEGDRDAALSLAEQAQQERDALSGQLTAVRAELDTEQRARAEATASVAQLQPRAEQAEHQRDAVMADAETLKTDLAQARAAVATELDARRAQRAVLVTAMRGLFVDASARLLQKEIDRGRKHQATAEKLRAWVDTFYPLHRDTVRAAFRPIVEPWAVLVDRDATALLERLVDEHIGLSVDGLRLAADGDEDERAAALERLFRRWETERADHVGDALVREGMAA